MVFGIVGNDFAGRTKLVKVFKQGRRSLIVDGFIEFPETAGVFFILRLTISAFAINIKKH